MKALLFEYDRASNDYAVYSGPPDIAEMHDHLGYLTCHPAPGLSERLSWKFEASDLPLLEWEIKGIYDKIVELNDERE